MAKKYVPSCWQLVPTHPVPAPEPEQLTDEELAQVHALYEPLDAVIEQFIDTQDAWPYEAVLEALARLTDYYEGLNDHMNTWLDAEIAADEADA